MPKSKKHMTSRKQIDEATEQLNDEDRQRVINEIKWLKTQRILAILVAIGSVIAFLITNSSKIYYVLYPNPKIRVIVEDLFVREHGKIELRKTNSKSPAIFFTTDVKEAKDWIPIQVGAYRFTITVDGCDFFERDIFLKKGGNDPIIVPKRETGSIQVLVKNYRSKTTPSTPLELSIKVSGNGYLWVFDWREDEYEPIYPPGLPQSKASQAIRFGEALVFPQPEGEFTIYSGEKFGEERLLFVVTSSKNFEFAEVIAIRMSKNLIPKATARERTENWGVKEITYKVCNGN